MEKWILYVGTNRLRENEVFTHKGFAFKKGYMYKVTPEVFEFVKALRGFETCKGIGSEEVIDFPKPKKENVAKSFVNKWDEQRKKVKQAKAKKK